jgi:hypothetical protein
MAKGLVLDAAADGVDGAGADRHDVERVGDLPTRGRIGAGRVRHLPPPSI